MLTLEQIRTAQTKPPRYEDVPVPEWDGTVRIRALTGDERETWEAALSKRLDKKKQLRDQKGFRASLVILAAVNEDGSPLFTSADVDMLGSGSARVLDDLYDAAAKLAGVSKGDEDEMLKNSDGAPSAVSG